MAVAAALLAVGVIWVLHQRPGRALAHDACHGCNLLLITIDTLRLDRVGAFGGRPGLTPNLDRIASEGFRLTRAYASAPLTLPSHTSIMTAVSPPVHGVRNNSLFRLGDRIPTLASVLKSAGYRTGAFVGAFVLDARFGLNRGFDVYDDRYGEKPAGDPAEGAERRAEEVVRPAEAWILNKGSGLRAQGSGNQRAEAVGSQPSALHPEPFFAWVHLYDPHEPYRAPEPYASQHEPYDAEVAYTDAMVGRLLDDLAKAGQLDRTLVVVAADHGESLGEHGERTHGVFVYDVTMRVPWMMWAGPGTRAEGSGLRAGSSSDALVRLIDLAPTTLDLIGIAAPSEFEGRSVVPAVNGEAGEAPPAYLEAMDANLTRNWAPLTGIATRDYKLIDLPIPELYDIGADPDETENLFTRQPERARTLEALLRGTTAGFSTRAAGAPKATLDADARARLQALGYVTSSAAPGARSYSDADDPKTLIGPAEELNRALETFNRGARADGMRTVAAIRHAHPAFATASGIYASMQRSTGDLPGAIATLEDLVRRNIADQSVMVVLAGYLQESGALDRAAALLQAVIAAHPDYAEAYNSLGVVASRQGKHAEARAAYRRMLELDPTSARTYANLGADEFATGEFSEASSDLQHALSLDPKLAAAHNVLAAIHMRQGQAPAAIAEWKLAIELEPALFDALYNLAVALDEAGRHDEARPYIQRFVNEAPRSRYGQDVARLSALLDRR